MALTGVFYAFGDQPEQRENLLFFLRCGLLERRDVRFNFTVVTEADRRSLFPEASNVKVRHFHPSPSDLAAHAWATQQDKTPYDYYVFMNSTCRGPFLPAYENRDWTDIVVSRLAGKVKLVGPVLELSPPNKDDPHGDKPFVHTYMFALDRESMGWIRSLKSWSPTCDKTTAVRDLERGISAEVLRRGANVESFLLAHQGVDWEAAMRQNETDWTNWKSARAVGKHPSCPEIPGNYFGIDIHPLEAMFVKNYRPASAVRTKEHSGFALAKELGLYSLWRERGRSARKSPARRSRKVTKDVGVFCHVFYPALAKEFRWYFGNIGLAYDLFVTTQEKHVAEMERIFPDAKVSAVPNRGRDICGFLSLAERIQDYRIGCKVHTKMSLYRGTNAWRQYLLKHLLGSPETVSDILRTFDDPSVGVVYPEPFPDISEHVEHTWWDNNFPTCRSLCEKMGIKVEEKTRIAFPAGSMFWFRTDSIKPILDLGITPYDFVEGPGETDGMLQHAVERLFVLAAEKRGYVGKVLPRQPMVTNPETIVLTAEIA